MKVFGYNNNFVIFIFLRHIHIFYSNFLWEVFMFKITRCEDVVGLMEDFAPPELAEDWDNVGLMVGDFGSEVKKILVALDVNDSVIDEAISENADLIITHHPFIFGGIKNVTSSDAVGKRIIKLIKNNIAVYSAHTNLDIAENGTNDTLAKIIGLQKISVLIKSDDGVNGLGRIGELANEMSFIDFINQLKTKLRLDKVTVTGDKNKVIKKVGLSTGQCAGREYMTTVKKAGCDVYITGDLRYHEAQFADNIDLCVVDITHYGSEVIVVPVLCEYLNNRAKSDNLSFECIESKINGQTLNIV